MTLRIYNTQSRKKEEFHPLQEGKVGIYVCGITAYDVCHVGHARSAVVFDVITRYLRYRGCDVTYVKNFTDVDDKIIDKARREQNGNRRDRRAVHPRTRRGYGGARRRPSHLYPPGDGEHRRDDPPRDHPARKGAGLPHGWGRLLLGGTIPGVREAFGPEPRGHAGRRPDRRQRQEAQPPRFRPLEGEQGGGALVGKPLGPRPAGVAPRVLRDEPAVSWGRPSTSTGAARI